MKLSAAIEAQLLSGAYNVCSSFMCILLDRDPQTVEHTPAVTAMVNTIHPNSGDIPLVCALHAHGIMNINYGGGWDTQRQFNYTQQLYCWWVFDLKRKGL